MLIMLIMVKHMVKHMVINVSRFNNVQSNKKHILSLVSPPVHCHKYRKKETLTGWWYTYPSEKS